MLLKKSLKKELNIYKSLKKSYYLNIKFRWILKKYNYIFFLDYKNINKINIKIKNLLKFYNYGMLKVSSKNFLSLFNKNELFNFVKGEFFLVYFNKLKDFNIVFNNLILDFKGFALCSKNYFINWSYISDINLLNNNNLNNYYVYICIFLVVLTKLFKVIFKLLLRLCLISNINYINK